MNTKLTLSIDSAIIDKAKRNLQTRNRSLSSLVEDYFRMLIATKTKQAAKSSIVKELTGIAKVGKNTDEKEVVTQYLLEKYQ